MTREGPPLGSGRRTGLPLASGGRGPGQRAPGCWDGLWVGDAGEARRGQDATLAFRSVGSAGLRPKARGHKGAGRVLTPGAPRGAGPGLVPGEGGWGLWLGVRSQRTRRPRERAWASGPAARRWRGFRPRTRGISVRGRLDASSFYLDTASLFQPAGTCTVLS